MTAQDNVTLVRTVFDVYNTHESDPQWLEQSIASTAEDCELINVPLGITLVGPEGLKQFLLGWSTAFPDSRVEITNLFATEDQAVVEFIGRGTHTGPLQGPAGDIPATGRRVEIQFCYVYRIRNGKFVSLHAYYDAMGLMQQLGLIPAMG